jgi:hypothetical protein
MSLNPFHKDGEETPTEEVDTEVIEATPEETPEVAEEVAVEAEAPKGPARSGCKYCNNTGLEPNVALSEAGVCPKCEGSPFGV